ncbi:hypothetical protein N8612_03515 [Verrucomicrobia bacterium]|nr:hypothetical protein [Verrucomicrobiota bacterium]
MNDPNRRRLAGEEDLQSLQESDYSGDDSSFGAVPFVFPWFP